MVTPSPQLAHCWQFVELCALVTGQKTPGELLLGMADSKLPEEFWESAPEVLSQFLKASDHTFTIHAASPRHPIQRIYKQDLAIKESFRFP